MRFLQFFYVDELDSAAYPYNFRVLKKIKLKTIDVFEKIQFS